MRHQSTFKTYRAQIRIERLLAHLEGRMLPASTLAELMHCDQSLVTEYLRYLRSEPRRVRIAGSEIVNGVRRVLYGLGSEPDVPMPRMTNKERYARLQSDHEKYERHLAATRDLRRRKRAAVPPEQRQRDRRTYDPPLDVQIVDLLTRMPGCTTEQVANRLEANERAVQRAMQQLSKAGTIQRAKGSTMKKWQWELPDRPMTPTPRIKPQKWFSVLAGVQAREAA